MNKKKLVVIAIIIVFAAAGFTIRHTRGHAEKHSLRVSGNIEITEVNVSFKLAGKINERTVNEGTPIKEGDLIARLDNTDLIQELELKKAELRVAESVLAELETGTRPEEIEQAEALSELSKAEAKSAQTEHRRQKELLDKKVISAREYEMAETAMRVTDARAREITARLTLLKNGPRKEQISAARARTEQMQQSAALAQTRLNYATLVSPLTGIVLAEDTEAGEFVSPGTPVVTIGDLNHVWLRAYLNETDLGRIRVGQSVQVKTDTYPDKVYDGRVSFISDQAEFTPKNVQTEKERTKLMYRIKIDILNENMELKPGMPADATIPLHKDK